MRAAVKKARIAAQRGPVYLSAHQDLRSAKRGVRAHALLPEKTPRQPRQTKRRPSALRSFSAVQKMLALPAGREYDNKRDMPQEATGRNAESQGIKESLNPI